MNRYRLMAATALAPVACLVPVHSISQAAAVQVPPSSTAPAPASPTTAPAPDANDPNNVLNQIVVTAARRRSENVQTTPVAVTALNAALLERNQVSSATDLARIAPNLIIQRQLATANQVDIYLRGFGNISNDPSIDPPIALYVDGIYQPIGSGTQLDTFGLESIEVERGPQGTLLGKNAPTGAITFTARRPTGKWDGAAEMSYERFDHKEIKGRIDIPLIPGILAVNGSLSYRDGGNYIRSTVYDNKRIFGGERALAARLGLLFTPTDNFEWLIQMNGENTRNPQAGMRDFGYSAEGPYQQITVSCAVFGHCSPSRPFYSSAGWAKRNRENDRQVSSTMTLKLAPVTITAVTGYKHLDESDQADVDGEPEAILDSLGANVYYHQVSQEIRISSAKNGGLDLGGHLDWVLGGFFSDFKYTGTQALDILGTTSTSFQQGRTKSYALFAHLVYNFSDKFNVTFGARQSWDHKTHSFRNVGETTTFTDAPLSFKNFSVEGGAQYKFSSSKNVYFRYAEGYRNGGYQGLPAGDIQIPYKPETVKTYEIGAKADFLDHHLRTNISIFQSDYKNLQRTAILALPVAPFYGQFINNAANARVRGVELETTIVPTDALTIAMTATYLDPKYKNYNVALIAGQPPSDHSGFPFPYAAKYTFKVAPEYVLELGRGGKLTFNADMTYSSTYYTGEVPYPLARVRPMAIVNGGIRYDDPSGHYYVKVYGENLTNKHYIENYTTQPTAPGNVAFFSIGVDHKPVTWGVAAGFKF